MKLVTAKMQMYIMKNIGNCDQNEFSQNKAINTVNIAVAMDEAFCFTMKIT